MGILHGYSQVCKKFVEQNRNITETLEISRDIVDKLGEPRNKKRNQNFMNWTTNLTIHRELAYQLGQRTGFTYRYLIKRLKAFGVNFHQLKMTIAFLLVILISVPAYVQKDTYVNPVSDSVFAADPHVLFYSGLYYLYATSASDGFKYWTSKNLCDWTAQGYAFRKTDDSWAKGSFWAPEVLNYQDKFYLIYSASGETMYGKGLRICLAVSDSPGGPFTDLQAPWFDLGFSCIDGHVFVDTDGKPYLYYEMVGAVGEHWNNKGYLWGVVMGVELSHDLSKPLHEQKLCLSPTQDWECAEGKKAISNEGMTVFKREGVYYMTYSGNHYADPEYGVGYATSDQPLGLWTKFGDNPILKQDPSIGVSGPGHNSIIKSPDQTEWLIIYHSHANPDNPSGNRILNIDRLIFNSDKSLSIKGPTRTPQPLPSGS